MCDFNTTLEAMTQKFETSTDQGGQGTSNANDQVQESNARELILSKVYFDITPMDFGVHGPRSASNGCTLLSVPNYLANGVN